MESEASISYQPSMRDRVLAAAGPVLWIAISYVDPGKWAASVEGGARFGFDLSLIVLVVNCAAILCQYLCARIAIATGKNLAQICSEEYDDLTCLFLGIEAEISMILLDLTMVIGTAYGLHAVFGIDLLICVFLTGFDAALFPFLASILENPKAKITLIFLACFILASYGTGVLISQPESSLSAGGTLTKLTGENAYALMSVLGANIMPHNFYLHSSIVQQDQRPTNVSKGTQCHDHFFATLCIFSGIFLVNCMLMNLAANVYYGSGLVSLTLQDALSLMDQGFRSSLASIALIVIMFFSNQLVAVTWSLGRQVTVYDFFRLEIPGWLHRATIKLIAIVPALFCILHSGAEGIFQLLIFTQVVVGLLLPSSIIPLFRIASSRPIMGAYRISHLVEFLALFTFVGVLGIMLVFVTELLFGGSDWVISLKWNIGSSVPISYLILLVASFASIGSMLWLAITPLKSANSGGNMQALRWDRRLAETELAIDRDPARINEQHLEKSTENQESMSSLQKSFGNHQKNLSTPTCDLNLPETLLDSETNICLTTIEENRTEISFSNPDVGNPEEPENELALPESDEIVKTELPDDVASSTESNEMVEKTLKIEGDTQSEKDEGESWEPRESTKDVPETALSSTSEGPGSYRSIRGKNDDLGSGTGSLSRLAGLGRAARRQLTAILDEFWGQLFDFHGQPTSEAKTKKLDVLLGIESTMDSKPSFAPVKSESFNKDSAAYSPSAAGRGSTDLLRTPNSFYGPPVQHIAQGSSIGSTLGVLPGSTMWSNSNQMQLLDAYVRNSSPDSIDSGERRYRSMYAPSSSIGHDQQPSTFHGYDLSSDVGQLAKEKSSDYLNYRLESSIGQTLSPSIKSNPMDLYTQPIGLKPQNNGMRTMKPPGFHNVPVARNSSMKSERAFPELSPEPMDYSNSNNPSNVKKFHSLPDISGLYVPQRDSSSSDNNNSQWQNNLIGYGQSVNRQMGSGASSWTSSALGFNQISTPKVCRDAFSLQFGSGSGAGSFYSRQPYEQFGVADKSPKSQEPASAVDMEAKLLQSLRICVMKLLKLEGSDWLFRQNDGVDEDLIDRVAAREKFLFEVETRTADAKLSCAIKIDEIDHSKFMSVPNCGDGCVYRVDLVVSFGVWGIHRILELSLMESRPELWGKYTYVLNRLQGIIDLAFSKPRPAMSTCFCLQLPDGYPQKSSPPISNGSLPPPAKMNRSKLTTTAMLLDMIKDVEIAISCRKGRTGTAAGDVAFPKGKENLASVLKRYKRRLANIYCFAASVVGLQTDNTNVGLPQYYGPPATPPNGPHNPGPDE
ncbi:divalent metal cation transporter MntH, partial [Striga asiatica]